VKRKRKAQPAAAAPADARLVDLRVQQAKIAADRAEVYRQVNDGWEDAPARLHRLDAALAKVAEQIQSLEKSP
jgi:hypothetical protein